MTRPFSRRRLLVAGGALGVAGCQPPAGSGRVQASATVAGYSGKLKGVEAILENLPSLLTARAPEGWQWLDNRPATVGLLWMISAAAPYLAGYRKAFDVGKRQ